MQESLLKVGFGEVNPFMGPHNHLPIQDVYSDAIIGVYGHTIKSLFQKTGCYIFVPRETNSDGDRIFELSGSFESVERCKLELLHLIQVV